MVGRVGRGTRGSSRLLSHAWIVVGIVLIALQLPISDMYPRLWPVATLLWTRKSGGGQRRISKWRWGWIWCRRQIPRCSVPQTSLTGRDGPVVTRTTVWLPRAPSRSPVSSLPGPIAFPQSHRVLVHHSCQNSWVDSDWATFQPPAMSPYLSIN